MGREFEPPGDLYFFAISLQFYVWGQLFDEIKCYYKMFCFLIFYMLSCYFFFLKFYITFTISFRRKKNRSNVMTNFIFCLSTSRHRLNQIDLQELWHRDGTRPMKKVHIGIPDAFPSTQNLYTFFMIVRYNVVAVSQCMLRDSLG